VVCDSCGAVTDRAASAAAVGFAWASSNADALQAAHQSALGEQRARLQRSVEKKEKMALARAQRRAARTAERAA
jgi:hypothetical protein